MKKKVNLKIFMFLIIIFIFITFSNSVKSDGGIVIEAESGVWEAFDEEKQLCAINYHNGIQEMILAVNIKEELMGERVVWIFPAPAKPEKTSINIIKGFPQMQGVNLMDITSLYVPGIFILPRFTQLYPIPFYLFDVLSQQGLKGYEYLEGINVHERIENSGLTTELVSALDSESFAEYLESKDLELPSDFKTILDEYIGEEYSFVISWISDVEKFKAEQENNNVSNALGVFISFPTERIYYPLKPTSIYGSKRVPALIYVMGYVTPEVYPEIKAYTKTDYFFSRGYAYFPDNLRDFFSNFEKEESGGTEDDIFEDIIGNMGGLFFAYEYYEYIKGTPHFKVDNLKYTRIEIDAPSNHLTEDLWIERGVPFKVFLADFVSRFAFWIGLFFFVVCSCLASLLSGIVIFGFKRTSKIKFALFGLWNFLTLIGFWIAAYVNKIDLKFTQSQEIQKSDVSFGKIITRTLLIALVIPILYLFLSRSSFRYWDFEMLIPMFIIYAITTAFLAPFVRGYYKNKRIIKFIILFSILFIVLTVLFQYLLKLMFV